MTLGVAMIFRNNTKGTSRREITEKPNIVKIKNFGFCKNNVKRMRRQGTDGEKICAKKTI